MVENVTCRLPVFGKHRTALDPKEKQITSKDMSLALNVT